MSLLECPDCKKMISDQAPACIHCGRPLALARIDTGTKAKPSSLGKKAVNFASEKADQTFEITPIKTLTTLGLTAGYLAVLVTMVYLATKSADYWYLGLICGGVIAFVMWNVVSTAYKVEIIGTDLKVTRIIGTLRIGVADINGIKTGAGWIQLVCSDKTIGITDLENLDEFMQRVKAMNQQLGRSH